MSSSAPWATTDHVFSQAVQHHRSGQRPLARHMCDQVLRVDQAHAGAWHIKGVLAFEEGQHAEAIECLAKSSELEANNPHVARDLGVALKAAHRLEDAEAALRRAIELEPQNATLELELGNLLIEQRRGVEAMSLLRATLGRHPRLSAGWIALGEALELVSEPYAALHCFHQAVACDEENAASYAHVGRLLFQLGYLEDAIVAWRWSLNLASNARVHSQLLLAMTYSAATTPEELHQERDAWNRLHGSVAQPAAPHENSRDSNRRLRVGYMIPDLTSHPAARFLEPVLSSHDRDRFETFLYLHDTQTSSTITRLQKYVTHWRSCRELDDDQLAARIRHDQIDILIDVAGHSHPDHRLRTIARRPAPVQLGWLGYPGWSGVEAMDHFLTDDIVTPRLSKFDGERPWQIPSGLHCFWPEPGSPEVNELPALSRGFVTFAAPHHLAKINSDVLLIWSRLLGAMPDSRLLLFRPGLDESTAADVQRRFSAAGIDADRVECLSVSQATHGYAGYLSMFHQVDVMLDTFPANAGTTGCESLWMGVPVLTLAGDRPAGRQTASLLFRLGLQSWIARSDDEYLGKALRLSTDINALATLRSEMRKRFRRTTVGDVIGFTRGLESSLRELWKQWCTRPRNEQ